MKRQIFSLIFCFLTTTSFLSFSMGEMGTFKEIDTTCNLAHKEKSDKLSKFHRFYVKSNKKNKQNTLARFITNLKLMNIQEFQSFLTTLNETISLLPNNEHNLNNFILLAFDILYQTSIDKKKFKQLLLNLPSEHLPYMIESAKVNLILTLIFEELTEHLKDIPNSTTDNGKNIWKSLTRDAFLHFFLNQYLYKS